MNTQPTEKPPLRRLVHRLVAPEEFSLAISGGCLEADFLAPREAATHVEQFQSSGWAMDFHEAKVKARIRCELPRGWGSLGLMRGAAISSWYGREVSRGALVCTPPGEAIDGRIAPGFSCISIAVPGTVWDDARESSGCCGSGDFGGARIFLIEERALRRIECRIRYLRGFLENAVIHPQLSAAAGTEAAGFAKELLTEAWIAGRGEVELRDSRRNRTRLARRAEDWMRAHLGEPIVIPDLCRTLGVSRRELEYAFRQTHDESPRDFLHALRLNAIRRELLREKPTNSLSLVALTHGITHFGRFSAAYRRMFRENPSETRAA